MVPGGDDPKDVAGADVFPPGAVVAGLVVVDGHGCASGQVRTCRCRAAAGLRGMASVHRRDLLLSADLKGIEELEKPLQNDEGRPLPREVAQS
ncbi:hypothetical protein GCM10014715_89060 [Streptomyces spiralis]|uniref:Uncharacterized protein n=1 Tax=Streptomyces spiralis TaxID=66376 RepID=A0A919AS78_9ACTN|nr:hypothetical protein GCM10014715_89060 [Streptomyces spiralis]